MAPDSLFSLAEDHLRLLIGGGLSSLELKQAPFVAKWSVVPSLARRLDGVVEGVGLVNPNNSLIWSIDIEAGWVRTTERLYRLRPSDIRDITDLKAKNVIDCGRRYFLEY